MQKNDYSYVQKVDYLLRYQELEEKKQELRLEVEKWETYGAGVKSSSDQDGMPHGSAVSSKVEKAGIKCAELQKKIENVEKEQAEIKAYIDTLNKPRYRLILTMRYVQGKKIQHIATELKETPLSIRKAHHRAVNEIQIKKTE